MVYAIEFAVETPVMVTYDVHLDSIFCCISPANHNKGAQLTRFSSRNAVQTLPIPIDCIKIGGRCVYCCSTADYINAERITENFTKRHSDIDYHYLRTRQNPRSGIERDMFEKLYGVVCEKVQFMVSSSSRTELNRYCGRVLGIGTMIKQGYGKVCGYTITEAGDDWKQCVVQDGLAIRNIPQGFLKNQVTSEAACMPPYWMPSHIEPCAKVGETAELKSEVFLGAFRKRR